LDILKDKWSPALGIRTVLLSLQALLSAPNPDDPLANDIAQHWKNNEKDAIETGTSDPTIRVWPEKLTEPLCSLSSGLDKEACHVGLDDTQGSLFLTQRPCDGVVRCKRAENVFGER